MQDLYMNGEMVPEFDNAPELFFDAVPFWEAFTDLSSSRQSGFSTGYIPYSETTDWLNEQQILSMEERNLYRRMIAIVDKVFVEKQAQANSKNNTS